MCRGAECEKSLKAIFFFFCRRCSFDFSEAEAFKVHFLDDTLLMYLVHTFLSSVSHPTFSLHYIREEEAGRRMKGVHLTILSSALLFTFKY